MQVKRDDIQDSVLDILREIDAGQVCSQLVRKVGYSAWKCNIVKVDFGSQDYVKHMQIYCQVLVGFFEYPDVNISRRDISCTAQTCCSILVSLGAVWGPMSWVFVALQEVSEQVLKDLRKRKLVTNEAWTTFHLSRGPKFALQKKEQAIVLTAEMLKEWAAACRQAWLFDWSSLEEPMPIALLWMQANSLSTGTLVSQLGFQAQPL